MKSPVHPVIWAHRAWPSDSIPAVERGGIEKGATAGAAEYESVLARRTSQSSLSTPLRIVGIMAFCQALVFVVIFLFLCARAGAATAAKPASTFELILSAYTPQNARDPFGAEVTKAVDGNVAVARTVQPDTLKLQGILYNKLNPSALVNDQLLELNKLVKLHTEQGDVEVKAVEITPELVTLDVGGRKMELRLGGSEPGPAAK